MEKNICALIMSFFVYGFCGWIWESIVLPLCTGNKFKNSGFLNGPIVPIYGVGAITMALLFSPRESLLSIFLESGVVACVIEYVTSWAMEKLYHRRWWDYSDKAFHVNGRICLEGFLIFGLFGVIAVKYIQPNLMQYILQYQFLTLVILSTALSTVLIVDLMTTVIALTKLDDKLDEFVEDIENYRQVISSDLMSKRQDFREVLDIMKTKDGDIYTDFKKRKKYIHRRIIRAFPDLINKKKER